MTQERRSRRSELPFPAATIYFQTVLERRAGLHAVALEDDVGVVAGAARAAHDLDALLLRRGVRRREVNVAGHRYRIAWAGKLDEVASVRAAIGRIFGRR